MQICCPRKKATSQTILLNQIQFLSVLLKNRPPTLLAYTPGQHKFNFFDELASKITYWKGNQELKFVSK